MPGRAKKPPESKSTKPDRFRRKAPRPPPPKPATQPGKPTAATPKPATIDTDQHAGQSQAAGLIDTRPTLPAPSPASPAVHQAKTWLISGAELIDVLTALREHYPKANPTETLAAACGELRQDALSLDAAECRDAARGFCLNAFREVYRRAIASDDFTAAISALRQFRDIAQ